MAGSDPLLDVAVALADGATVDWASAAQSITVEDDRRLLDELRFIAGMVCSTRGDGLAAAGALYRPGTFWGPLKIIEHIGRGTFGDVYRAWDSRLDREVALKVLRRKARDDSAHASTVIEEGRLLARVRHPSVVTVYGAERVGGQVGVWMEFVQGRTLEQELRDRGPFDVERVIRIGIDLSGALSSVHRAGLIHVLAELGRQPRAARAFFIKYQDRVLFGKDSYQPDEYLYYWRTLETADEYFDYYRDYHAFCKLYGLDLPDDALRKLYYANAVKLVPGLPTSRLPR